MLRACNRERGEVIKGGDWYMMSLGTFGMRMLIYSFEDIGRGLLFLKNITRFSCVNTVPATLDAEIIICGQYNETLSQTATARQK